MGGRAVAPHLRGGRGSGGGSDQPAARVVVRFAVGRHSHCSQGAGRCMPRPLQALRARSEHTSSIPHPARPTHLQHRGGGQEVQHGARVVAVRQQREGKAPALQRRLKLAALLQHRARPQHKGLVAFRGGGGEGRRVWRSGRLGRGLDARRGVEHPAAAWPSAPPQGRGCDWPAHKASQPAHKASQPLFKHTAAPGSSPLCACRTTPPPPPARSAARRSGPCRQLGVPESGGGGGGLSAGCAASSAA